MTFLVVYCGDMADLCWQPCKFIRRKGSVYIKKEFNFHRIGMVHQHGRRHVKALQQSFFDSYFLYVLSTNNMYSVFVLFFFFSIVGVILSIKPRSYCIAQMFIHSYF